MIKVKKTRIARPFVKWAGGKRNIVEELLNRLPAEIINYYEPFLGGGALFYRVKSENYNISDLNIHLINAYNSIKLDYKKVIKSLKEHKTNDSKEYYYSVRKKLNIIRNNFNRAALFIYLNKTCYSGLYRVNSKGIFNVPYANYENAQIFDEENFRLVSLKLEKTTITSGTFENIDIKKNSFYYFDPPYHKTYSSYSKEGFNDQSHIKLAEICTKIDQIGSKFMLSNSDTPFIRELFKNFEIEKISASRYLTGKYKNNSKIQELIIRNYK
jgi:DNA adenine methylase